ncbi:pilus assembly protein PilO [Sporosarcina sp. Te-1]|uniref:pilus assembly protein PilO n=1 Tax=Sporosarcina sp. Te-1 TaxID=2818390 RepID=UPI001AA00863|nr:pilus assembly protein PilO [Sporosarcina sp. Te-1]QTD41579.1 pilus assembly protein PilO [Sporosarcina sp. Te-1]
MNNLSKRQKEMTLVILSVVFLLALSLFSYFRLYAPAKEANELAASSVSNERKVLFALEKQKAKVETSGYSSSRPLQTKVPVVPLDDKVLLQIGEAEVKSGMVVEEVNFTREPLVLDPPVEEAGAIQTLVAEVKLQAGTYGQVDRFIEELESMERIFIVDSLEFSAPEELRTTTEEVRTLELVLTFRAFYRPDLTDLSEEAPKVDAPKPAGKEDPTPFNSAELDGEESDQ